MDDLNKAKPKTRRRLDHLADFQDGIPFTMIPQKLLRAWLDKKFPDSKFRLLCCMLSNAEYFHVKSEYLRNRFAHKTLSKYRKELEEEGYIEVEEVLRKDGGFEKVYHVLSVHNWAIMRQVDERDLGAGRSGAGRSGAGRSGPPLKKIKENEINLKENKGNQTNGWVEEGEQPANSAVDVIDIVKKVEPLFANPKTGFVPFSELNAVFAEIKAKQGKEAAISFADYLKQIWEASSQGAWLGTGSKKPQDFRLSVLSFPKYLAWWEESSQESLDCARMPH